MTDTAELDLIRRLAYRLAEYHQRDHRGLTEEGCATCLAVWEATQMEKEYERD